MAEPAGRNGQFEGPFVKDLRISKKTSAILIPRSIARRPGIFAIKLRLQNTGLLGSMPFKKWLQNAKLPGIRGIQRRAEDSWDPCFQGKAAESEASWDPCHAEKGCRARSVLGSMPFKERLQNPRRPGIHAIQRKAAEPEASWDPCRSKKKGCGGEASWDPFI